MNIRTYYLVENEQQQGPFTRDELAELSLTPNSLVWYPGLDQWQRAYYVEEIRMLFPEWVPTETVEDEEALTMKASGSKYFLLAAGAFGLGLLGYLFSRSHWSPLQRNSKDTSAIHPLPPVSQPSNHLSKTGQRIEQSHIEGDSMMVSVDKPSAEQSDRPAGPISEESIPNGFEDIDQPSFDISNLSADSENYNRWKGKWVVATGDPDVGQLTLRDDGLTFWVLPRVLFTCTGRFEENKLILSFQLDDAIIAFKYPRCGTDILEMELLENNQCRVRWLHEDLHRQVITRVPEMKSVSLLRRERPVE
jgi:hypothetical protein